MQASGGDRFEWWHHEPGRLAEDRRQLQSRFPALTWSTAENGLWIGDLPMWPFDRDPPQDLDLLLGGRGLQAIVRCGQAYPAAPPSVIPLEPEPEIEERTQQRWHVNGNGSLCLFQNEAVWNTRGTLVDVLLKAAGWRIEYALMKTGLIDTMTINGIVTDPALDDTIAKIGLQDRR